MKARVIFKVPIIGLVILTASSCLRDFAVPEAPKNETILLTKTVVPETFDWETIDWMPTPPGQAQIPMPWGGQGSISAFYGADIVSDYRKQDGWRLVYSTFRDYGEELIDPYFMLYNVYRGTLRIYFYLTEPYIGESTYLQDGLVVQRLSGTSSNLLNYLGNDIVDTSVNQDNFNQVQPKMPDGGSPLAGRRWYMMEYELAYDPSIGSLSSEQIWLSWRLNYYNIMEMVLNGTSKSEIYGTVGGSGNFLNEAASATGRGVIAMTGLGLMDKLTVDNETGENKLGLSGTVFNALKNGVESAVNSFGSGIPELALNLLNVVFGGTSSSSSPMSVSLKSEASIQFNGKITSQGSVSSTPVDFKIPGTDIASDASGYIPLYNNPLGVFYVGKPLSVSVRETIVRDRMEDDIMGTGYYEYYTHTAVPQQKDYSSSIIVNPYVKSIADISVISQEVLAKVKNRKMLYSFPLIGVEYDSPWESDNPIPEIENLCIRFVIKVQPKDGTSASYLCKTFYVDDYSWTINHN